jgi:hypothetical protein
MEGAPNQRIDTDPQQRQLAPLAWAGHARRWAHEGELVSMKKQRLPRQPLMDERNRPVGFSVLVLTASLAALSGCAYFSAPEPVHVVDPTSPCAGLRASHPSRHGLVLFEDSSTKSVSIPWCFPATAGRGVPGYNVNIPVTHAGTFTLVLSDVSPPTQFAAVGIAGTCAGDHTGKRYERLGYGTRWSMRVVPGDYCITLIKSENEKEDVTFMLTATRP